MKVPLQLTAVLILLLILCTRIILSSIKDKFVVFGFIIYLLFVPNNNIQARHTPFGARVQNLLRRPHLGLYKEPLILLQCEHKKETNTFHSQYFIVIKIPY